jgi:hypothetical protein
MLGGGVEVAADSLAIAHGGECVVREIPRKAGDETEAREMLDSFVNLIEQIGEGRRAAASVVEIVVIDGLAEESDLRRPGVGEFADFVDDVLRGAMDFSAAGVGDDAVGAEFIAAAGDTNVSLRAVVAGGDASGEIEHLKLVFGGGESGGAATSLFAHERGLALRGSAGVADQTRQFVEFAGAAEDVNIRMAFEEVGAVALGEAADDADNEIGVGFLAFAKFAEARPDFLFGVFADGASVVKDYIGIIALGDGFVSECAELAENEFAVEHVHLAAECFEVEAASHDENVMRKKC